MVRFLLFIPDMQGCRLYLFIEDVRRLCTERFDNSLNIVISMATS